jgi:hypothetical protein
VRSATLFATTIALFAVACADGAEVTDYQPPTGPDATATDPCNGVTYAGTCDGTTVTWCDDGKVYSTNCKQSGYAGCQFSGGVYDCYGKGAGAFAACKTSCSAACDKVPCTGYRLPQLRGCKKDRDNCKAACPCTCYQASPTGIPADQSACGTACNHACSVASSKCMAGCGSNYGCNKNCTSAHADCIMAGTNICY